MSVRIEDHSRKVIDAKNEAISRFLEEAGLHLMAQSAKALELSPKRIDTGLLKNSITYALDGEAPATSEYSADHPKKGSTVIETGSYSGTTPEEPEGKAALYVGTNVEYSEYVHEGTVRMEPNRFLKNAFEKNAEQLKDKLKEALEGK